MYVLSLARLKETGAFNLLTAEILALRLTDAGLSLVKAAGLKPGDPVWKLIERAGLIGFNLLGLGAKKEITVITGIRKRLRARKLDYGELSRAVYEALGVTPPANAPEEPPPPTLLTLAQAEHGILLLQLASVIDILAPEVDRKTLDELKQRGYRELWHLYMRPEPFHNPLRNVKFFDILGTLGLPTNCRLADDLVARLECGGVFETPLSPPPPLELPTARELELFTAEVSTGIPELKQRRLDLIAARDNAISATAHLGKLMSIDVNTEAIREDADKKIGAIELELGEKLRMLDAISTVTPVLAELELVLKAMGR